MIYIDNLTVFNGVELSRWVLVDDIKRPVQPKRRLTTTLAPGQQVPYMSVEGYEPYTITLHARLRKHALADIPACRNALSAALIVDEPKRLLLPDDVTRSYLAMYQGDDAITISESKTELTLSFLIVDPIAYGATHELAITDGDKHEIVVGGTQPTYPRFSIDASHASGTVGIVITKYGADDVPDKLVKISASVGVIIVDMERERAYTQGASAARIDLSSDFFSLTDGDKVRITCNASGWSARMSWEERYV